MSADWRPETPAIADDDFSAFLADNSNAILYFWAEWNGVDRDFTPLLDTILSQFEDRIAIRSVDVSCAGSTAICEVCRVPNVPALSYFRNGKRLRTVVGARSERELQKEFSEFSDLRLSSTSNGRMGFSKLRDLIHRVSGRFEG